MARRYQTLLAAGAIGFVLVLMVGSHSVDEMLRDNRSPVYEALVLLFGSLLGFSVVAGSFLLARGEQALAQATSAEVTGPIRGSLVAAMHAFGVSTLACLLALVLDTRRDPSLFWTAVATGASLASLVAAGDLIVSIRRVLQPAPEKAPRRPR